MLYLESIVEPGGLPSVLLEAYHTAIFDVFYILYQLSLYTDRPVLTVVNNLGSRSVTTPCNVD